jgi:acyl carrier protein
MRDTILEIIRSHVMEIESSFLRPLKEPINESTQLFGTSGLLDSVGLVTLTVAVEQAVEDAFNVSIAIASEKAMSQSKSPFRTVGSLTDWVVQLLEETTVNG